MVIFGKVASFDVLMQNFYKVTKGNNEKVLSFATFGNPKTTYSMLMVAARKAEGENEDTKEKVKAPSPVATEVSDGSKELGNQIAQLMATLNRVEQGTCPASAPNSPRHRHCGRGRMDRNTPVCPRSHNGQTGLGKNAFAHSSSIAGRVATASQGRGSTQASTGAQGNAQNTKDPSTLQCFRCQGWGHKARECATLAKPLNRDGGTKGMWSNPHSMHPVNSQHSIPDPNPKLTHMKAAKSRGWQQVIPILFLNLDPIACLIGHSNKVPVIIDGQEVAALIDSEAQILNISAQLCEDLTLQIQPLGQLLELEGTGGAAIPYLRYVEVNLQILGIKGYNEDVLLLVIPTMTYAKAVLVVVGTNAIDKALSLMTLGEFAKATITWRQTHFGAVMSGSLQLFCSGSGQCKVITGAASSIHQGGTVEVWKL